MTRLKKTTKIVPADLEVLGRHEVASALGRSLRTVDRLIARNELGCVRIGRSVGVTTAQLRAFLARAESHPFDVDAKVSEVLSR